jgi:hypothetical protein
MSTKPFQLAALAAVVIAATCAPVYAQPVTQNPTANVPSAGHALTMSGVEAKPGNIISIMVPTTTLVSDPKLAVHVTGAGKTCQYHLVVINTDTNKESYFPQTSKFPALVHANLPLDQFAHGNYKVAAMALGADKNSGMACLGGGEYTPFKIERLKLTMDPSWPRITDLTVNPGKSATVSTYRTDESLGYSVLGSVDNLDPKNADKRCGWTVLLEGNGQSIQLGNGTFFKMPMTASLAAVKPGSYTLKAHTTAGDDNLAKMSCLGSVSKAITIVAAPGQIKGVKLEARGIHGQGSDIENALNHTSVDLLFPPAFIANLATPDYGVLRITPQIDGAKCYYKVSIRANGGALPTFGVNVHTPGVAEKPTVRVWSQDVVNVDVTIEAGDQEKALGAPCEGTITKSIQVKDDPKLPLVVK